MTTFRSFSKLLMPLTSTFISILSTISFTLYKVYFDSTRHQLQLWCTMKVYLMILFYLHC